MQIADRLSDVRVSSVREVFNLAQKFKDVINLGIGEPCFDTPAFIRRAAKEAIDSGRNKYTVNLGILELRKEIAKKLKRENGIEADPEKEIIVTAGATQAIFALIHSLINPGDEILLPTPTFNAYFEIARMVGAKSVEVPMRLERGYHLDVEEMERRCTPKTKLLVFNSPGNPTGVIFDRNAVEQCLNLAERRDLMVLSDEIYEKYVYDGKRTFSPASVIGFKDRVITVNGFSKSFGMTGWRLGYASAPAEVINAMTRFNMYNVVCANSPTQAAGVVALRTKSTFFKPILKGYARRREIICKELDKLDIPYVRPEGSFYLFADISKFARDSKVFAKALLLSQHVSVVAGSSYGAVGEGHIRISFSTTERDLRLAMKKMGSFLKTL
jgi:aminotransferase